MSDHDRYRDSHAHPPGFEPVQPITYSGPLMLVGSTPQPSLSLTALCREVVRIDRNGKAWIDGKEASDAEIGAAVRRWAAASLAPAVAADGRRGRE